MNCDNWVRGSLSAKQVWIEPSHQTVSCAFYTANVIFDEHSQEMH